MATKFQKMMNDFNGQGINIKKVSIITSDGDFLVQNVHSQISNHSDDGGIAISNIEGTKTLIYLFDDQITGFRLL